MNQFGTILKFELKNYFKNKVFVGVTLFIVAVIAIVIFFPKIAASFESDSTDTSSESLPVMLIAADSRMRRNKSKKRSHLHLRITTFRLLRTALRT